MFVLITMFGGTFWSFKNIFTMASKNDNPFFTRFNQLYNNETSCDRNYNKYDVSPFKNEYRRLINRIKVNVYNTIISDIQELLNVNVDHKLMRDLIMNNFHIIHTFLCKKYLTTTEIKYKSIVGLYILAIFLTECSHSQTECSQVDTSIHDFVESKLRYLNIAKIQNLDNIMLYYDHKVNLQLINIDNIYC